MQRPQKAFSESGSSPPLRVSLMNVQLMPGSTVALGEGIDERGRVVSFVGDWRPMKHLGLALAAGSSIEVTLEAWQVLSARAA